MTVNNIMILDVIGNQLVDTELVHAEFTKVGSALVEVLSFFSFERSLNDFSSQTNVLEK